MLTTNVLNKIWLKKWEIELLKIYIYIQMLKKVIEQVKTEDVNKSSPKFDCCGKQSSGLRR